MIAAGLSALVVSTLFAIFAYLVVKGASSLNWTFLTQTPKPVGEAGGGMANCLFGSVLILLIASVLGLPVGIGAGIYLAEYGHNRLGQLIRFTADVLNGVPSIVIGLVAYGLVVVTQGHFSAFSGGVALAIMMVPILTRNTEEMLRLVPQSVREAAFGLGIPQWRTTISITLATARAPELLQVSCWRLRVWQAKPRLSCLPRWGTRFGVSALTSRLPHCHYRFTYMRILPTRSGTGRPGLERCSLLS